MNFIQSLVRKHDVAMIVVGNPINMDGSAGPRSEATRTFAERLAQHVVLDVKLWDERLTTVEAQNLLRETGRNPWDRTGSVDQMAALLLLESFLEAQRAAKAEPGSE
jgi:putative Holliday junction resolvase